MSFVKQLKDYTIKILWNGGSVPIGLFELSQYFRANKAINFEFKKEGDEIIAISKDFKQGTIITSAKTEKELDENIKDAILTTFEVPSSYKNEAGIQRVGQKECYAFA
jgi:hypothetical protein